ncbi:MAG: ATP-dependent helicase [Spirochaetia bacterium]
MEEQGSADIFGLTGDVPPYLESLNERQRAAVLHEGKPLLILAGAGSGKTRVITTKIAYLIDERGVDPRSILAVTFTNKAAGEMVERVREMVPGARGMLIRTFHSFGAWLLRRNSSAAGLHSGFSIYDEDDSISLLGTIFEGKPKQQLKSMMHLISRAKDYALKPDDDLMEISGDPRFAETYAAYQKRLDEIGNVDFGDLILKPVELLKHNEEIRKRLRQRFRIILVDEYQDSNVAQFRLLEELYGDGTYLCVVGDDDQSIYKFRGAEVRNIIDFPEIFPGTEIIKLEENYRSTGTILDIASAVVANNRNRLGKSLWTRKEAGIPGTFALLEDSRDEVRYCAELLGDGNLAGTAVLYRTNAQSREFEIFFSKHNIPYRLVGTVSFYSREEVKDALSLLRFLINPADEVAFRRIVNKPARGIGKAALGTVLEALPAVQGDLLRALEMMGPELRGKARKGAEEVLSIMNELGRLLAEEPLHAFLRKGLERIGLLEYHRLQDEQGGTNKIGNLEELVSASADYPRGTEGLVRFLEDIELDIRRMEEDHFETERVTLITMHNTKGLEFPRVIITGLEDGLFPSLRSEEEEDIEEERRIFYVSITRAEKELYFTSCRRRRLWGKTHVMYPSRFLEEIPREYLRIVGGYPGKGGSDGTGGTEKGAYPRGTRVYHDDYGEGTVFKQWMSGTELTVEVVFDTGRKARFLPEYTPLERII